MPLIKCANDGWAPGVVVCVHLLDGESHDWCPMPSGDPEVDHDWLCPDCYARVNSLSVGDIRSVCMRCANELRKQAQQGPDDPELQCLLYCLGMLGELERLGLAEGPDRLSERGTDMYRALIASGYKPAAEEMLLCLTELTGEEEAAQQLAEIVSRLKNEQ